MLTGLIFPSIFHPSSVSAFSACALETPMIVGAKALQLDAVRRDKVIPKNFMFDSFFEIVFLQYKMVLLFDSCLSSSACLTPCALGIFVRA